MDNIDMFLRVLLDKGFTKDDLFLSTDLYNKKNMPKVITVIQRLALMVDDR